MLQTFAKGEVHVGEIAYTFADVESTKHNSYAAAQANANCQGNNLKFKKEI